MPFFILRPIAAPQPRSQRQSHRHCWLKCFDLIRGSFAGFCCRLISAIYLLTLEKDMIPRRERQCLDHSKLRMIYEHRLIRAEGTSVCMWDVGSTDVDYQSGR